MTQVNNQIASVVSDTLFRDYTANIFRRRLVIKNGLKNKIDFNFSECKTLVGLQIATRKKIMFFVEKC